MGNEKKPGEAAKPEPEAQQSPQGPQGPMTTEIERDTLLKSILEAEYEKRTLMGILSSCSPKTVKELQDRNKELKERVIASEKTLALELLGRKTPIDAVGCSDRQAVLKSDVLAYCTDRKISESVWKKLSSL